VLFCVGSGIDFASLLVLNTRSDIELAVFPPSVAARDEQCSDVLSLLSDQGIFAHGHNEDGDSFYKDNALSYLVQTSTAL